ncbi:MAG: preprotein translocase subunit SecY [bacterium]
MAGWTNIGKIPELQKRLLFTLLILAFYRLGVHVWIPGINPGALENFFEQQQSGGLFSLINTFTGGGFQNMSVFALGIMPYITASIILQLLTVVFPYLDKLQKEGEVGKKKITQYTRYLTVGLSIAQGMGIAFMLQSWHNQFQGPHSLINIGPGESWWSFRIMTVITITAGTALIMWLGEQITERGIGNGISLIIFAGIVARTPAGIYETIQQVASGTMHLFVLILIGVIMVAVIAAIIFVERAQRKLPVQYPARTVGRKMYKGVKTHLPLKINQAGVIPPIFASSLLSFPTTISGVFQQSGGESSMGWMQMLASAFNPMSWQYNVIYGLLIMFFTFFYTAVTFNPIDVSDNLKRQGGYIPGVRPGQNTSDYIDRILTRITTGGSVYLVAVCVLPSILMALLGIPFYFGGTGLLIVVGVAMDTASQMESHLIARHYDGFLGAKGPKMK